MDIQGNVTKRLSGNAWVDTAGTVAVYTAFVVGIPLVRANWSQIQKQMQASGVSLVYGMRDTYETTVRFQKQVRESRSIVMCMCMCMPCAFVGIGCADRLWPKGLICFDIYVVRRKQTKLVDIPPLPPFCPFSLLGNRAQTKIISFGEPEDSSEDSEEGKRNNILQKAILLYIGFVSRTRPFSDTKHALPTRLSS